MDPATPTAVTAWLRASRGEETQDRLAADITAVTGWRIDRSRYSRYESGMLPIGKQTLKHFTDYWATRGVAGPDLTPAPVEAPSDPQDRIVKAIEDQTAMLEKVLTALTERAIDPAAVRALQEWAITQATIRTQPQTAGPEREPLR